MPQRQGEVYCQPAGDGYAVLDIYAAGQAVPLVLDGTTVGTIPVADLFRRSESA